MMRMTPGEGLFADPPRYLGYFVPAMGTGLATGTPAIHDHGRLPVLCRCLDGLRAKFVKASIRDSPSQPMTLEHAHLG